MQPSVMNVHQCISNIKVFKYSYSLEQTEQFLRTLLDDEPVKTVVASESVPENNEKSRVPSKERVRTRMFYFYTRL